MPQFITTPRAENAQHEQIQELAYLRIYQIIGDPSKGIPPLLPIGRTSWLEGVKSGKYPQPVKHGRSSFWRASDITNLLATLGA